MLMEQITLKEENETEEQTFRLKEPFVLMTLRRKRLKKIILRSHQKEKTTLFNTTHSILVKN